MLTDDRSCCVLTPVNNNNNITLSKAKSNLERATSAVQARLLALRAGGLLDLNGPCSDLYYHHSNAANQKTFERHCKTAAKDGIVRNDTVLWELADKVRAAYAVVIEMSAAEKARLTAKRAEREARSTQREALGVDLKAADRNATVATYKTIRRELAEVEAHYVAYQTETLQRRFKAFGELTEKVIDSRSLWNEVSFFYNLTRDGRQAPNTYLRTPRADVAARIAKRAKVEADEIVASFAAKLAGKVDRAALRASVVSATISSTDLWCHSLLEVKLSDGSSQSWYTQMIINRSCLGKLFNQWPTRRTD